MKIFILSIYVVCFVFSNNANAMFEKLNKSLLGRPKLRKPTVGSVYLGAGLGIPIYGSTYVGDTYIENSKTTAIISAAANGATESVPITIPIITATVGYLQVSLPIRHEFSISFINNTYSINKTLTINGSPYTKPDIINQMYLMQYYAYGYWTPKISPVTLFAGAGGGIVIFNTSLSDSTSASSSLSQLSVGGTVGVGTGFTYRISDDMALQVKLGYKAISSSFNISGGSFPFVQILDINLDIFFKIK